MREVEDNHRLKKTGSKMDTDLLHHYQQLLHLESATFSRITHEDATVAMVYHVRRPSAPDLILKICDQPHHFVREVYFLTRLAQILPVPRVIQILEPGAILMESLSGALPKSPEWTSSLALETGSALAKLHNCRTARYGDPVYPEELSSDPRVLFSQKFEEGLAECSAQLPQKLIEECRRYFTTHLPLLNQVDGPCFAHRDFRPGNLLVHSGKLQGIIDWASARFSFAEEDLCPVEYEWQVAPKIRESFFEGYARVRPIPDFQTLLPLLRLTRAIAIMGFMIKKRLWNSSHSHVYQSNLNFIESISKQH